MIQKYFKQIVLTLSVLAMVFSLYFIGGLLDNNHADLIVIFIKLAIYGTLLASAITLFVDALKDKLTQKNILLPIILFFVGTLLYRVVDSSYEAIITSFAEFFLLGIYLTTLILYLLARRQEKLRFPSFIAWMVVISLQVLSLLASGSYFSLIHLCLLMIFVLVIYTTNKEGKENEQE